MIKGYLGLAYHMMKVDDGNYEMLDDALYDEFGIDVVTFENIARRLLRYTQREHRSFTHLNVRKYSVDTDDGVFDFIVEYDHA